MIHDAFLGRIGQRSLVQIGNEHNFVWKRDNTFLHGKGATPAWRNEQGRPLLGLIPLNMAREILLVLGADNTDYLSFCPHGAGRNLSRTAMLRPYKDAEGEIDPARLKEVLSSVTEDPRTPSRTGRASATGVMSKTESIQNDAMLWANANGSATLSTPA